MPPPAHMPPVDLLPSATKACQRLACLVVGTLLVVACGGTAEQRLDSLRTKSETADSMETVIGAAPNVTYESVHDLWKEIRGEYAKVVSSAPQNVEARERLAIVEKRLRLLEAEHTYGSLIQLRNVKRGPGTLQNIGERTEAIFGEVRNLGDQLVVKIVLRFELLDAANLPVGDREWTPVAEQPDQEPFKPNDVRRFGFSVDNAPPAWVTVRGAVKRVRLSRAGAELPKKVVR